MGVFISWSGERSKATASALASLLRAVNPEWRPWASHLDLVAGARWRNELTEALRSAEFGVVCVSRASLKSPWVLFEVGALSCGIDAGRVCPYLIDLRQEELHGPLADFQACECDEVGTWKLVETLNALPGRSVVAATELRSRFESSWPRFDAEVGGAPEEPHAPEFNDLDESGLLNLLRIYYEATSDRLMRAFDQGLAELTGEPERLSFDLLFSNVRTVLEDGRMLLAPFYCELTGNVSEFLDDCLPAAVLEQRLERGIQILLGYQDVEKRRTAAHQLIQEEQALLTRRIRQRLARRARGTARDD